MTMRPHSVLLRHSFTPVIVPPKELVIDLKHVTLFTITATTSSPSTTTNEVTNTFVSICKVFQYFISFHPYKKF